MTNKILSRNKYTEIDRIKANVAYYANKGVKPRENSVLQREDHWRPEERDTYERLCRGEFNHVDQTLYCFYYSGNTEDNYFLQLGPVRTEVLSQSPHIVRFHDVYSQGSDVFQSQ